MLVDRYQNELIQDLTTEGKQDGEIFIRDFTSYKLQNFLFDAEKIVSFAEINLPEQEDS